MIQIDSATQRFSSPQGSFDAVSNVSLTIQPGEIFGIIGRSGAGKSTLVRMLNLLNRPTSGRIIVAGQDLTALNETALREARRHIGMIFQHFNLLSSRTVSANIALPLELAGRPKEEIRHKVGRLLDLVGLNAHADKYPAQLSGGQKQRVGIARALAGDPKVLLSDEATSALDPETTRSILELLRTINRELKLTIVLITHQMEVIKAICDKVAVMEAGAIVETGRVLDIFRAPAHAVTRAMIGETVAQELPPSVLARLQARLRAGVDAPHASHLFRLAFTGESVEQPILSEATRRFDLDFSILHGQIDQIGGEPFGSLAILANGARQEIDRAMAFFAERGVTVEELNHVV